VGDVQLKKTTGLLDLMASRLGANVHSKLNALVRRTLLDRTTPTGDRQAHFSTLRPMRNHDVFSAGYLRRTRTRREWTAPDGMLDGGCIGRKTVFVCISGTDVRRPLDQSDR
jgi:hypothetical protein